MVVASCRQIRCVKRNLVDKNVSRRRNFPDWMEGPAECESMDNLDYCRIAMEVREERQAEL